MKTIKLTTKAHGAFPTVQSLISDIPRIAFVNSDEKGTYIEPQLIDNKLLIVGADDIDVLSIPAWTRGFLVLPAYLSYRVKRYSHSQAKSSSFPCAPMSIGDATQIVDFYRTLEEEGATELVISCEYGKSRSVTTANFIKNKLQANVDQDPLSIPNAWVDYLLNFAKSKLTI